jgi:AcrR family transcriptional regulator
MTESASATTSQKVVGVRQLHRELTRERLAEAAVELFSSAGYLSTTIDDITAAAGTTRATFYLHFKSKAELALELSRRLGDEYRPVFAAMHELLMTRPDRDGIRAWLDTTLNTWERNQRASAALSEAALLEPAVEKERSATFERDINQLAQALQKSGRWTTDDARARAVLVMAQLEQLFMRWSVHGWDVDRDAVLTVLTDMWTAALVPEAASRTSARRQANRSRAR